MELLLLPVAIMALSLVVFGALAFLIGVVRLYDLGETRQIRDVEFLVQAMAEVRR